MLTAEHGVHEDEKTRGVDIQAELTPLPIDRVFHHEALHGILSTPVPAPLPDPKDALRHTTPPVPVTRS